MLYDLVIAGSGPAGLLLYKYLKDNTNFNIKIISPSFENWHCRYGLWSEEIENTWISKQIKYLIKHKNPKIITIDSSTYSLNKEYSVIDNVKMIELCINENTNDKMIDIVQQLNTFSDNIEIITSSGKIVKTKKFIDCTGHYSGLTEYDKNSIPKYWQSFYGEVLEIDKEIDMVLFDWRKTKIEKENIPSFGYILPLDDKHVLFEETVLVKSEKINLNILKNRLEERKKYYKVENNKIVEIENYQFPMGGGQPIIRDNRIIPFGASARMVHPATGYMIGYMIKQIPEFVNNNIFDKVKNNRIFSIKYNKKYIFYQRGGAILSSLNQKELSLFFEYFFNHYPGWFKYITRTNKSSELEYMKNIIKFPKPVLYKFLVTYFYTYL